MRDKAYVERANGRWEVFTISDGQRIYVGHWHELWAAFEWAARKHYQLIRI